MPFPETQMKGASFPSMRKWMKSSSYRYVLLAAGVLVPTFTPSCQKYEEGPLLSFRSPEKRVTNEWTVVYAEDLDKAENITEQFDEVNYSIRISKNDSFQLTYNAPVRRSGLQQRKVNGTWEFVDDAKKIRWEFQGYDPYRFLSNKGETTLILKLRKDELWMQNQANDLELHLKPL
jgi:hypothetical protein